MGLEIKPISLEIDLVVYHLIKALGEHIGFSKAKIPKIIRRGDYGYILYLNPRNVTDDLPTICDAYEQIAFLLSMACLLGIGDMHAENVLVSLPSVYLLDLETAFSASEEIKDYSIYDNEINPISRSGMLLDVYDIPLVVGLRTGIQGGEFPINARTKPKIVNDGTDKIEIKYIRDIPVETVRHHNRIYYTDGRVVSIFLTEEHFATSFSTFYSRILNNISSIKEIITHRLSGSTFSSRRIFFPTSMYRNFISIQQHIESYVGNNNFYWNIITKQLRKYRKTEHQNLIDFVRQNELLDLNEGIIPYFYRKSDDCALYHISGALMINAYERTIEEELLHHVTNLPSVEKLLEYINRSYDSVRNLKTSSDLDAILQYHENKRAH